MTNQKRTFNYGSIYSGAGIGTSRLKDIGGVMSFGIDIDEEQTRILKINQPETQIITENVLDFTGGLPKLDILQASPPCCTYSGQRKKSVSEEEYNLDLKMAASVYDYALKSKAEVVIVENVPSFFHRKPSQEMHSSLVNNGYLYTKHVVLTGTDFGLPVCRKRGFQIFAKNPIIERTEKVFVPPVVDWLNIIGDAITINNEEYSQSQLSALESQKIFPVIMPHVAYFKKRFWEISENAPPILAHAGEDGKGGRGRSKIWSIVDQDLKRFNVEVRGFARLMGVPDGYSLPSDHRKGLKTVGNGIIAFAIPWLIDRYNLLNCI